MEAVFRNRSGRKYFPEGMPLAQPFFTTLPIVIGTTGQATGLGLSLAYDIVKAHGGDIKVISNYFPPSGELGMEKEDGSGSEFIIRLPVG
ncbi:MAG TPA: hypothetical protein PKM27_18530 [Saprospiraceae bacterium]|nr:hypothetical protein [Saprospiraceae bacterium]HNT19123.1 hypothetical protein [Saprospiraceae bacterium]